MRIVLPTCLPACLDNQRTVFNAVGANVRRTVGAGVTGTSLLVGEGVGVAGVDDVGAGVSSGMASAWYAPYSSDWRVRLRSVSCASWRRAGTSVHVLPRPAHMYA